MLDFCEDYHSIKDDILLVSVYTTGNVTVRGMLIPGEFLTDDIRATMEYKEYEKQYKVAGQLSNGRTTRVHDIKRWHAVRMRDLRILEEEFIGGSV
ncbi:hypothetical protein Tco_1088738 [Tanacetum coccineum]